MGFMSLAHIVFYVAPTDHCLKCPSYNTYRTVFSLFSPYQLENSSK